RLIEGWRRDDGTHMAAVEIRMAPGWKTYWRAPGDGGIPPRLALDAGTVRIHWPRPEVFYTGSMRSIGYVEDVLLPIEIEVPAGAQTVAGRLEIGVCLDICLPVELALTATLPDGGRPDPRIVAALADRPLSAAEAGVGAATCRVRPISDGMQVEARLPIPQTDGGAEVVVELPDPSIWISDPATARDGGALIATADIVPADAGPFALDRSDLRFTVLYGGMAVEIEGCSAG
ncbi:MAG: protein-disulfide reductase DsbD domain-containing protein, partial [Pseudomonadota bacterium]